MIRIKKVHLGMAVVLSLATIGVINYVHIAKQQKPAPAPQVAALTYSTDKPDEQKPNPDTFVWKGRSNDPKFIRLPTIGAEGFVQNVGVDQNQEVAVPGNIHMAGWFVESVRPGQAGLSIIDGHVDGRQSEGIFKSLIKLKENDAFSVEMGDGSTKQFKVTRVTSVETAHAAELLFSKDPAVQSQLNLITCGGVFNRQSGQYEKRVIIVSELAD